MALSNACILRQCPNFVDQAKQALPSEIICRIGVRFNFICYKIFGGVSGELALRTGRCLQRKRLLASSCRQPPSAMTALPCIRHDAPDTMHRPSMFSIPWCGRANGAAHANRSSWSKIFLAKIFFASADQSCPQSGRNSIYRTVQTSATCSDGRVARWYRSIRLVNGRLSSSVDLDLLLPLLCRGLLRKGHCEHVLLEACLDPFGIDIENRMLLASRQTAE